jgi:hypothetical protein
VLFPEKRCTTYIYIYMESMKEKERLAASRAKGIVCVLRMLTTTMYKLVCIQLRSKDFPLYYSYYIQEQVTSFHNNIFLCFN